MIEQSLSIELERTLPHENAVYWASFSRDGQKLVGACLDNTARIWSVADGSPLLTLKGHGDGVAYVDFLDDGRIVTASLDRSLKIWSADGALKETLSGHQDYLACATLNRKTSRMASGGFDKAVRLWSADEPSAQAVLQGHTAVVQAVAFSADGKRLASGGSDQSIRLWDVASHKQLAELTGHAATVEALVFTNKGVLVSGAADGALRFWNSEGRLLEERFVRDARIKSLGLSDDALWLAVGCSDGSTRVYSAPERLELARVAGHKNSVYGVAFSPDGKRLATASFDRTIAVWTISARHPT